MLIAQLMGRRPERRPGGATPSVKYGIPNRRLPAHVVALPMVWETPLRTGNLRDPNGPQVTFAFEAFIDELAAAAQRTRRVPPRTASRRAPKTTCCAGALARGTPRGASKIRLGRAAVAETAGAGPDPTGRGIAYTYRGNTVVAVIADVEVNRKTGHVWVKRLVCAHDCGLAINPMGLQHTVECGMCTASAARCGKRCSSTREGNERRLGTHPSCGIRHAGNDRRRARQRRSEPESSGPAPLRRRRNSHKPVIAAVANAIFDATGVRLRRAPFRKERVLAALRAAAS